MMETVTGHWQCKEQRPLDKEQERTGGSGQDCSSLSGETGGKKSCPRSHGEPRAPSLRASHFTPAVTPPGLLRQKISRQEERGRKGELPLG